MAQLQNLKINGPAVRQIHNSGPVMSELRKLAEGVRSRAGAGQWNIHVEQGPNRARAAVVTGDRVARMRQAKEQALSRAIGGGGGAAAPSRSTSGGRARDAQGRFIPATAARSGRARDAQGRFI